MLADFFPKAAADIAEQVAALIEQTNRVDEERVNGILQKISFQGWDVLIDPMQGILEEVVTDGGAEALLQIGIEDAEHLTDLVNLRAVAYAEKRAADLVGMTNIGTKASPKWIPNPRTDDITGEKLWSITDSTREMIRRDVTTATEEGWSAQHLAKVLDENNAFSQDYRAMMIARTEARFADVEGNMEAYRQSGIVQGKEWIVGSRHDHDDECTANQEAGEIAFDARFPSGDNAAPAHPNCVCDVLPVLMPKEDTAAKPITEPEPEPAG